MTELRSIEEDIKELRDFLPKDFDEILRRVGGNTVDRLKMIGML